MSEIPSSAPLPKWQQPHFLEAVKKYEGARALFVERPTAAVVRVTNIRLNEWGVKLDIQDEKLPGFGRLSADDGTCPISVSWVALSESEEWWTAQYVTWSLYFNAERLGKLIELAGQEAEVGELIPYPIAGRWMRSPEAELAAIEWPRRDGTLASPRVR